MRINDGQEESTFEISLIWEVVSSGTRPGHNDLDLGEWEASLLEICAVLPKDNLPLVVILLICVKECVRNDCVVFNAARLLSLGLEPWTRCDNYVLVITSPTDIDNVEVGVLHNRPINRQNAISIDCAE